MAKRLPGSQRRRRVNARWSEPEYEWLANRAKQAGAPTIPAYLRRVALTGHEIEHQPWAQIRDLRNELTNLGLLLKTFPPSKSRDETLAEIRAALLRICRT